MKLSDEEFAELKELLAERIAQKRADAEEQQRQAIFKQECATAERERAKEELRSMFALHYPEQMSKELAEKHVDRFVAEQNEAAERRLESAVSAR